MKKKLLFTVLSGLITFTSWAQSTIITPGSTRMTKSNIGEPLSVDVIPNGTGHIDFKRGGYYSAGINNTNSPRQLRLGIASSNFGVGQYNDIVIDSTSRRIGFGTNNPQYSYHFYSPSEGGSRGHIMLESYSNYPFLMLKGEDHFNKGLSLIKKNGEAQAYLYYNGSTKKMYWGFGEVANNITIDEVTNNVGIGTANPTKANLHVYGTREFDGFNLKIEETTGGSGYPILALVKDGKGGKVVGRSDSNGGINITEISSGSYAPIYASAFTIPSDINVKKEVVNLETEDFEAYLNQIRNIQSATYRYQWEDAGTRKNSHIGFIAQTLPKEVITEMDATPDGSSDEVNLGYNLSDMIGLNVIGIKAVDAKIQQMEEIIKLQQEQIALLIAEVENIKK